MEIKIPTWAEDIEDEGVLTFLAFARHIADQYGWYDWYTLHSSDISRMCNKRRDGLPEWLRSYDVISEYMEIGEAIPGSVQFRFRDNQPKAGNVGIASKVNGYMWSKLITHRAQLIWSYLLGCTNSNLISESHPTAILDNTFGISVFYLTRSAGDYYKSGYQKKLKHDEEEEA